MMRWGNAVLGVLGVVLSYSTPVWAQDAAKPEAPPGSALLTLLILFAPAILFMMYILTKVKRQSTQVDRSLVIAEQMLLLAKDQIAAQTETNRLLQQLIEAQGRD